MITIIIALLALCVALLAAYISQLNASLALMSLQPGGANDPTDTATPEPIEPRRM